MSEFGYKYVLGKDVVVRDGDLRRYTGWHYSFRAPGVGVMDIRVVTMIQDHFTLGRIVVLTTVTLLYFVLVHDACFLTRRELKSMIANQKKGRATILQ